jgi:hypothetical protein
MNLDTFTLKSQEAIFSTRQIAQDLNYQTIEPAHRREAADNETQDGQAGIDPGFPPVPAPGDQQ